MCNSLVYCCDVNVALEFKKFVGVVRVARERSFVLFVHFDSCKCVPG